MMLSLTVRSARTVAWRAAVAPSAPRSIAAVGTTIADLDKRLLHSSCTSCARARSKPVAGTPGTSSGDAAATSSLKDVGATATGVPGAAYRGAAYDSKSGKWKSSIMVDGKRLSLGLYDTAKGASDAYVAALAVLGEQGQGRKARSRARDTTASASASAAAAAADGAINAGAMDAGGVALITRAEAERLGLPVLDFVTSDEEDDEAAAEAEADAEADAGAGAGAKSAAPASAAAAAGSDRRVSTRYRGVIQEGLHAELWEAVVSVPVPAAEGAGAGAGAGAGGGTAAAAAPPAFREISGGEYETEEEAARAYDALARMYLGPTAPTNFPVDPYTAWVPPEEVVATGQIEVRLGQQLTVTEVMAALQQERGMDVRVIPLAGKSDLAEHLVLVTGRSVAHMRKMADTISRGLRKRRLPGVDPRVEARDMDDWMVVDCGNIIVSIMDAEAREVFALESLYDGMQAGVDPYAGLSYEEWLERNPIPDKWLARLERDEAELEAAQRMPSAPPQLSSSDGASSGSGSGSGSGGAGGSSGYNFPGKLRKRR